MTIVTTVDCATLPEVPIAMRRLRRARGIDSIVFVVAGQPWFHVQRTPDGWATTAL